MMTGFSKMFFKNDLNHFESCMPNSSSSSTTDMFSFLLADDNKALQQSPMSWTTCVSIGNDHFSSNGRHSDYRTVSL
jgi:hypothetical protein